jgi:protein-S-isoprenylcysteine O-methyltransferase Ste14
MVFVTLMLALRLLQFPRFPGVTRDVAFLQPWYAKLAFLPASLAPVAWNLEVYYRHFGYSLGEIRFLWGQRLIVWLLESSILVGYAAAWLTRDRARAVAKGFMQVVFPLVLSFLPFAILMAPYTFEQWMPANSRIHMSALAGITLLLALGEAVTAVGVFTLRRAFTMMAEARTLVCGGVYRVVRHPLYAGQFVTYLGYTLMHFHAVTVGLYVFFIAAQVLRARIEERKLAAAFPEYERYLRTTGMFWPRAAAP